MTRRLARFPRLLVATLALVGDLLGIGLAAALHNVAEVIAFVGLVVVAVSLWGYDPRIAGLVVGSVLIALGIQMARTQERKDGR